MNSIKKDFIVRRTITEVEGKPVVTTYSEEELVRCGDCEYSDDWPCQRTRIYKGQVFCKKYDCARPDDWFCADGIRRISE